MAVYEKEHVASILFSDINVNLQDERERFYMFIHACTICVLIPSEIWTYLNRRERCAFGIKI